MNFNARATSFSVSFIFESHTDSKHHPFVQRSIILDYDLSLSQHLYVCTIPLQEVKGRGFLLVSTDIASRGFDLPQTSHIYNFELPKTATDYLHRAGRTGREPFSKVECSVTTLITEYEHFVLQRFQNELKFHCENLHLESMFTFNL
jgi:ERCC4-related helicase